MYEIDYDHGFLVSVKMQNYYCSSQDNQRMQLKHIIIYIKKLDDILI